MVIIAEQDANHTHQCDIGDVLRLVNNTFRQQSIFNVKLENKTVSILESVFVGSTAPLLFLIISICKHFTRIITETGVCSLSRKKNKLDVLKCGKPFISLFWNNHLSSSMWNVTTKERKPGHEIDIRLTGPFCSVCFVINPEGIRKSHASLLVSRKRKKSISSNECPHVRF